jgi:hypothetical protein
MFGASIAAAPRADVMARRLLRRSQVANGGAIELPGRFRGTGKHRGGIFIVSLLLYGQVRETF